ncbi:MAG: ThuA domain-containing protein [Acidobacteria bacterium]|nr:ThuA domain-containing protein [Acidobacteriota bacterium]
MRCLALVLLTSICQAAQIRALIIDGQNNHQWQLTTPLLKKALEDSGLFQTAVATSPPRGADMSSFRPEFEQYQVVISNYSDFGGGGVWPPETQAAFEKYLRAGGGFVTVHAADNAFPSWKEYNVIIGLGGWGGRDENSGPYIRYRDGKFSRDMTAGKGGHHGRQHEFQLTTRDLKHPIMLGLPEVWMHAKDELYDSLRGPAQNLHVVATAFSDPATGGTGEHEPALMTIAYGKGRVFHTILGHGVEAIECTGFIVTFQRGVEWAATGKVTQKAPSDFPGAKRVSIRP